jgi:hypothetical protein
MAKKHFLQMTTGEKKYIINRFKSIQPSEWKFNEYSKKKAVNRKVDLDVMRKVFTDGFDLIEYHKHDRDRSNRILLRTIATDKNNKQVCIVFNLTEKEITTVYLNDKDNKHQKLDWSYYDETIDVKQLMKAR